MAKDYIGCYYLDKDDNDIIPASDISKIDVSKGEFADAGKSFVSLVDLDLVAYRRANNNKTVRRNVSLPSWLNKAAEDAVFILALCLLPDVLFLSISRLPR